MNHPKNEIICMYISGYIYAVYVYNRLCMYIYIYITHVRPYYLYMNIFIKHWNNVMGTITY